MSISIGTYFFTYNRIYCYENNKITVIEANMEALFGFEAYDKLFVMLKDQGLAILENNELIVLPYTSNFTSEHRMYNIVEFQDEKLLIGTRNDGFYTYNLKLFKENNAFNFKKQVPENVIEKLESNATDFFDEHSLYSTTKINDSLFAFGTTTGGIALINEKANIVNIINTNKGLNSNCIYSLFCDKTGNLWAGTQFGNSYITLNYPLRFFNEESNNLIGYVISSIEYKNSLYIGTMSGLFKFPDDYKPEENIIFEKLNEDIAEFWDFEIVDNKLLTAGLDGIFLIENNNLINLIDETANLIQKSVYDSNLVFIAFDEKFSLYKIDTNNDQINLVEIINFEGITERITKIVELNNNEVWLSSDYEGIFKINYNLNSPSDYAVEHYTTENGLPVNDYNIVHNLNGQIKIATRKGLYMPKINNDSLVFIQDFSMGNVFSKDSVSIVQIIPYNDKFIINSEDQKIGLLSENESGDFVWDNSFSKNFPTVYKVILKQNLLEIYTSKGLFLYDFKKQNDYSKTFDILINKVALKNDFVLFSGNYINYSQTNDSVFSVTQLNQPEEEIKELSYKNNSLFFEYSALFFENAEKNQYSYKLEGFDNEWSNYSDESKAVFTNIREGKYGTGSV